MLKRIKIEDELHRQVKATAALCGVSMREWVESVLSDALAGRPSPSVLVDTRTPYSINPRYDCNPNETDEEESDE